MSKAGRRAIEGEAMVAIHLRLPQAMIDFMKQIGYGSVPDGIRSAIRAYPGYTHYREERRANTDK